MGMKLLIGGSPCTHWSIAQKNNRETEPSGMGWELFKNFLIAKEKFKPDFFLYENNKSAAQPIKDQIAKEFGVTERSIFSHDNGVRMTYINSALVSAQNRQRFYVTNFGDIEQPEDRGILLKDILETGMDLTQNEKSYCLTASYDRAVAWNTIERSQRTMVAEPVGDTEGKSFCLTSNYPGAYPEHTLRKSVRSMVAEPIRIGTLPNEKGEIHDNQSKRIYSTEGKSVNITSGGSGLGAKTGLCACPYDIVRVGDMPNAAGVIKGSQSKRIYSIDGKTPALQAHARGGNSDLSAPATGLYAAPVEEANYEIINGAKIIIADGKIRQGDERGTKQGKYVYTEHAEKSNTISAGQAHNEKVIALAPPGNWKTIYEVRDGQITIKGKQYPIKLADGYYIIRKLTVKECCRLQTMPDDYCRAVSNSQAYKGLGNGWTAEVIIHLLNHTLKNVPRNEPITVLSMYDGIGTGRYCLDKMGYTNVEYHAYEIDKYAMQIAMSNYPDIIQHGDAFAVREDDWKIL